MPRGRRPKDEEEIDEINDVERYTASTKKRLQLITARYLLLLQREAMKWKKNFG